MAHLFLIEARRENIPGEGDNLENEEYPERPGIGLRPITRRRGREETDDDADEILDGEGGREHRKIEGRIGAPRERVADMLGKPGIGENGDLTRRGAQE